MDGYCCMVSVEAARKLVSSILDLLDDQNSVATDVEWPNTLHSPMGFVGFVDFCEIILGCSSGVALTAGNTQAEAFLTSLVKRASTQVACQSNVPSNKTPVQKEWLRENVKLWPLKSIAAWKSGAFTSSGHLSHPVSPVRSVLSRVRSRRSSLTQSDTPTPSAYRTTTHDGALNTPIRMAMAAAATDDFPGSSSPASAEVKNNATREAFDLESKADFPLAGSGVVTSKAQGSIVSVTVDVARWHRAQWNAMEWPAQSSTPVVDVLTKAALQCKSWGALTEVQLQRDQQSFEASKYSIEEGGMKGGQPSSRNAGGSSSVSNAAGSDAHLPPPPLDLPYESPLETPRSIGGQAAKETEAADPTSACAAEKKSSTTNTTDRSQSVQPGLLQANEYTNLAIPSHGVQHGTSARAPTTAFSSSVASFGRASVKSQFIASTAEAVQVEAARRKKMLQTKVYSHHSGLYLYPGSPESHQPHPSPGRARGLSSTARSLLDKSVSCSHSTLMSASQIVLGKVNPRLCYSRADSLKLLPPQSPPGSPYQSEIFRLYVHETGNQGRRVLHKTGTLDLESSKVLMKASPYSAENDGSSTQLPELPVFSVQPSLSDARNAAMLPWDASQSFSQITHIAAAITARAPLLKDPPFADLTRALSNEHTAV